MTMTYKVGDLVWHRSGERVERQWVGRITKIHPGEWFDVEWFNHNTFLCGRNKSHEEHLTACELSEYQFMLRMLGGEMNER
jgi:hypothetical protein